MSDKQSDTFDQSGYFDHKTAKNTPVFRKCETFHTLKQQKSATGNFTRFDFPQNHPNRWQAGRLRSNQQRLPFQAAFAKARLRTGSNLDPELKLENPRQIEL
ncbi:MAG: hypothetical protein ABL999_00210 [Pyrinomonadaceae bacterium]